MAYGSVAMTCTAPVAKRTTSCVFPDPLSFVNILALFAAGAAGSEACSGKSIQVDASIEPATSKFELIATAPPLKV